MNKNHVFEIKIGDWSGDGHGKYDGYQVQSNKPVEEVREAYFKARTDLPEHLCPERFMSEYEDSSLPEDVYHDAKKLGFDFLADYDGNQDPIDYLRDSENLCQYVIWFLKQGDPTLKLKILPRPESLAFYGCDEKGRHISFIGYGLFT